MNLSRDVSKVYVRRMLEQRTINTKDMASCEAVPGQVITSFSSANKMTSEQEKAIICGNEDSGVKRKILSFCFKYKETIRKIPFIGEKAVQIKRNRLEESMKKPILDMAPYLSLHFREFIGTCYRIMLNREADSSGIATMADMARNGASNECFVYMVAMSPEFAGRYTVKNIKNYKKRYKKYLRGMYMKNAPVLGRIVKLFAVSSKVSWVYTDLDYRCTVLESMMNDINGKLSLLLQNQSENNIRYTSELASFSMDMDRFDKVVSANNASAGGLKNDIADLRSELKTEIGNLNSGLKTDFVGLGTELKTNFQHSYDMLTGLHQKADEGAGIMSTVSVKLDELPPFIEAKNLQARTSIASYSDGVVGVQCGDYFFGVPSEEWGLAYFLMINGHFEHGSEKLFCSLLKPDMTVLDLGANLGIYTLHALKAGCEVYSFEPIPRIYGILGQNIKANGFADTGKAHLYNYAVSNENGIVEFFYVKQMCGQSSNMYGAEGDSDIKIAVHTVALDDCLKDIHHVDIIKIDIEGAEYQAFHGMNRIISENPQVKILLEFAPGHIIRAGMEPKDVLDYYSELGFHKYLITENGELCVVSDKELIGCFSENLLLSKEYIEL